MQFGEHLKEWRSHRRMSQLDLATEAGISARHLSFLETGRSRPTEGMILRLSSVLDIPARDQGMLFSAAGFRPRFGTRPAKALDGLPPAIVQAVRLILDRHDPYPGVVFDHEYNILAANAAFSGLAGIAGAALSAAAAPERRAPRLAATRGEASACAPAASARSTRSAGASSGAVADILRSVMQSRIWRSK